MSEDPARVREEGGEDFWSELACEFVHDEPLEFTFRGRLLKARRIRSAEELLALEKRVEMYTRNIREGRVPPAIKAFGPVGEKVVRMCVYLEAILIDPPIDFVRALDLAKNAGMLVPMLISRVMPAFGDVGGEEEAAIEDAKND